MSSSHRCSKRQTAVPSGTTVRRPGQSINKRNATAAPYLGRVTDRMPLASANAALASDLSCPQTYLAVQDVPPDSLPVGRPNGCSELLVLQEFRKPAEFCFVPAADCLKEPVSKRKSSVDDQ